MYVHSFSYLVNKLELGGYTYLQLKKRSKLRHYLKFPHGILLLRITSNPITCNHLLNHILGSMTNNPLDIDII